MARFRNVLFRMLTSGKFNDSHDDAQMEEMIRYIFFNATLLALGVLMALMGAKHVFVERYIVEGYSDFALSLICFITILLLRTRLPLAIAHIPVAGFGIVCAMMVHHGDTQGFGGLWLFSYPLIAVFVLGMKTGLAFSLLLLAGAAVIAFYPGLAEFPYTLSMAAHLTAVYVLMLILTIAYGLSRSLKERWGKRLLRVIQTELDETAALKDHIKAGVFLMNRELLIQPSYSKTMESALAETDLHGKNFADLIAVSLTAAEQGAVKDYFEMVFNRAFKQEMLDDLNPLREFAYTNAVSGACRILNCGFAPVVQPSGDVYVLGTVEDVTAERELKRQLEEEEKKLQEEMRSMFEVVQVEPGVFNDFIEGCELAFARVNEFLKDKRLSNREAITEIYQALHAVKSDAFIVGLQSFGGKLHVLEDEMRLLRDKDNVTFDDMLLFILKLELIMQEEDRFRQIIDKILSFRTGVDGQAGQVLADTLSRACERAAEDLGKSVRFTSGEIDSSALEHGPRRVIKDVMTQLVRNAVGHGIESPEERAAAGKKAEGHITFSLRVEDGAIHACLKDNGRGLDYAKIGRQALKMKLIKPEDAADNHKLLRALFSPGFSTADEVSVHAGRGVGLSLVRDRVREVKGTIKVHTQPGKGTAFHIVIPLDRGEA